MIKNKHKSVMQVCGLRKARGVLWFESLRGLPLLTTLILSLPSLYFLVFVPPLWRDSDGFVQVATKLNFLTVIHFPPFYCWGARIPLLIGTLLDGTALSRGITINPPILTDVGLYLLLLTQHLLLIGSLLITCLTIAERPLFRSASAAFFALNPALYAFANCVGAEALSNVVVLLVAILGLRFVVEPSRQKLKLLFVVLVAGILTKHVNAILCALLSGTLLLVTFSRFFCSTNSTQPSGLSAFGLRKLLQTFGLVTLVGAAAIGTASATVWLICRITKIPDVSRLGYTFQWRLDYLTRLDPAVREATLARISSQLHDPATTYALQRLQESLNSGVPWDPQMLSQNIYERLEGDPTIPTGKARRVSMDHRLNKLALAFLLSGDRKLFEVISEDFNTSLTFSPGRICGEPFYGTDWLIARVNEGLYAPLRGLSTFRFAPDTFVKRWSKDSYLHLWNTVPLWSLALLVIMEVLAALAWRPLHRAQSAVLLHALAAMVIGGLMLLANCSLTFRAPRFALSTYILFLFAFILVGTKLCENLVNRSRLRPN